MMSCLWTCRASIFNSKANQTAVFDLKMMPWLERNDNDVMIREMIDYANALFYKLIVLIVCCASIDCWIAVCDVARDDNLTRELLWLTQCSSQMAIELIFSGTYSIEIYLATHPLFWPSVTKCLHSASCCCD